MKNSKRLAVWLTVTVALAGAWPGESRAGDWTTDVLNVQYNFRQEDPTGTNLLKGRIGLATNQPQSLVCIDGWANGDDIVNWYKLNGTSRRFTLQMSTVRDAHHFARLLVQGVQVLSLCEDGKVGIGVADAQMTNANSVLDVKAGALRLSSSGNLILSAASSGNEAWAFRSDGESLVLSDKDNNREVVRFDDVGDGAFDLLLKAHPDTNTAWLALQGRTGRIGIGTTNALESLHILGATRIDGTLMADSAAAQGDIPMGCYTNRP